MTRGLVLARVPVQMAIANYLRPVLPAVVAAERRFEFSMMSKPKSKNDRDLLHSVLSSSGLPFQSDLTNLTSQVKVGRIRVIMLLFQLLYQFLCAWEDSVV
jgi:hypothetical protein